MTCDKQTLDIVNIDKAEGDNLNLGDFKFCYTSRHDHDVYMILVRLSNIIIVSSSSSLFNDESAPFGLFIVR